MSNPFYIFTKKELKLLICILIIGLITGATLLNIIVGRKIDQLIYEKNELNTTIKDQEKQIELLSEKLNQYKRRFISSIEIELKTDINKHKQQGIKNKIYSLLENIIGTEIDQVSPLLLRDIVHNRLIQFEDNTYHLKLIYLVIDDELKLFFEITKSN